MLRHSQASCGKNLRDYMPLNEETRVITPPIAPRPSRALVQEFRPIFQGRLDLAGFVILNPGLPTLLHQPSCHKVVVVGVQDVFGPTLVLETMQELWALQDLGPVCAGSS